MFKHGKKELKAEESRKASVNNWGDDEYGKLIEGVKKIYRTKIRPLEVTYNFEGNKRNFFLHVFMWFF